MFKLLNYKVTEAFSTGDYADAFLICGNLINKNPGDVSVFKNVFSVYKTYCERVNADEELISDMSNILENFKNYCELNQENIDLIREEESYINSVITKISEKQEKEIMDFGRNGVLQTQDNLCKISLYVNEIQQIDNEEKYKDILLKINEIDKKINIDRLTTKQRQEYEYLTSCLSKIVEMKTAYFDREKNKQYNIRAINDFEKAFNLFKSGNASDNPSTILDNLFKYDASRLFQETLIYYNYVYNFILSKCSDEQKYELTLRAIESKKVY